MALYELDEFKPATFLGFVRSVPQPNTFLGTKWLPNQVIDDLEFEYILGSFSRPVMAHIMGFDSEAPIHGRPGVGAKVSGELPPIKRKSKIGEKEIIRFLQPRAQTQDVQNAIDSVYRGTGDLLDAIQARVEWLRMQALTEDKVIYDEAGVKFGFDFGVDDEFQINLVGSGGVPRDGAGVDVSDDFSAAWTDTAGSNPVLDLQAICNRVEDKTGRRPVEFVTTRKGANLLLNNAAMRGMIRGSGAPDTVLTSGEVQTLFSLYDLPTVTTYDVIVQAEQPDGTYVDVRPMAQNKSFLVPAGYAGGNKTLWGPTAESRVLFGTTLAGQAPGIWAETYGTTEPPAEWTKAAAIAFPSMPEANTLAKMNLF
jgi:Phage major capsid protein E